MHRCGAVRRNRLRAEWRAARGWPVANSRPMSSRLSTAWRYRPGNDVRRSQAPSCRSVRRRRNSAAPRRCIAAPTFDAVTEVALARHRRAVCAAEHGACEAARNAAWRRAARRSVEPPPGAAAYQRPSLNLLKRPGARAPGPGSVGDGAARHRAPARRRARRFRRQGRGQGHQARSGRHALSSSSRRAAPSRRASSALPTTSPAR